MLPTTLRRVSHFITHKSVAEYSYKLHSYICYIGSQRSRIREFPRPSHQQLPAELHRFVCDRFDPTILCEYRNRKYDNGRCSHCQRNSCANVGPCAADHQPCGLLENRQFEAVYVRNNVKSILYYFTLPFSHEGHPRHKPLHLWAKIYLCIFA